MVALRWRKGMNIFEGLGEVGQEEWTIEKDFDLQLISSTIVYFILNVKLN
jgi:hypothetical protein